MVSRDTKNNKNPFIYELATGANMKQICGSQKRSMYLCTTS